MDSKFAELQQLTLQDYIKRYAGKLLGSNQKLKKSDLQTRGLSLLPHKLAGGFNFCPSSTKGCRDTCIVFSGYAFNKSVNVGRYYRSRFFLEYRETFLQLLGVELEAFRGAVRLNVFSDIPWENYVDMEKYEWIQFYDYTKIASRYSKFQAGELPKNYHLTFSYSGDNAAACIPILESGGNVSVVFEKEVPEYFDGYRVINGDIHDARWTDDKGVIVGLKYKTNVVDKVANQIAMNSFVVKQSQTKFL